MLDLQVPELTKSLFISGCQCHDMLWWLTHAAESGEPDLALQDRFEQGREVGLKAREHVPGGVAIDPGAAREERVERTLAALDAGAPVIYEASFLSAGVFVSVDIMERLADGFGLIEVKSSTRRKEEHIPDAAIQTHVARSSGLPVSRVEVMHLNRECRYPELGDLFVREEVTEEVEELLPQIPAEIEEQLRVVLGESPGVGFGEHCLEAKSCPFGEHCWPEVTEEHVLTLYRVKDARKWEMLEQGIESIHDIENPEGLPKLAQRQVRAVKEGRRLVEPGLAAALESFRGPLAHLDFETVGLAVPAWRGCRPWQAVPVQFSCHRETASGEWEHLAYLAPGGEDCREELSRELIEACAGARAVVAYNAGFERRCLKQLAEAVPELAGPLNDVADRLVDLLPAVRDFVYDPAFRGGFGLKAVLPALVPELSYEELPIGEGQVASLWLRRLLLRPEAIPPERRPTLRPDLLRYCRQDTLATVRLLDALRQLAEAETES